MNPFTILKHPSAFFPVAMSLGALAMVLIFVTLHGTAPQADEGAAPHGRTGTYRTVLRDQAVAEVTKKGCTHPSPASRRCSSDDAVLAAEAAGHMTITRNADADCRCPIQP